MNQDRTNRKLAAIFSTDVAGYSRMMEADEAWTIQNLEENKKLMSALIGDYKGRVVDAPGDNLLAEFGSVINAVECAVKIQKQLNRKNSKLMEDHRMLFRIGVNLGDVVEEDGKIYGNGVNIAARLEGLAEPGGICISRTAYDQVKSKIEVDYDYLGEYQVKNINEPVRVYRILMGDESTEKYVPHGKSNKIINPLNIAISIIVLLVAALGTTIVLLYPEPPEPKQVGRSVYELPKGQQFYKTNLDRVEYHMAISPDGSQLVYATTDGLYLRKLNELNAKHIKGTDEYSAEPFFSPDGKWIGYFSGSDAKLMKININAGVPIPVCDVGPRIYGASWGKDDIIVYSDPLKGIMQVSAREGNPKSIIKAIFYSTTDGFPMFPQILPDGDTLLFTNFVGSDFADTQIIAQSLRSKKRKVLVKGAVRAVYLPTGYIIYIPYTNDASFKDGIYNLNINSFDLKNLKINENSISRLLGINPTSAAFSKKHKN